MARVVISVVVGVQIAVGAARGLFGDLAPQQIVSQTLAGLPMSLFVSVGIVTIVFAALERSGFPADHLRQWKPRTLPKVDDARKSAWESAFEVTCNIIFLAWWAGLIHMPWTAGNPDFRMEPAPVFAQLYWPIFALAAVRLVHNLIELLRPGARILIGTLAVVTTIAGLALISLLYRAGTWVVVIPTGMPAAKAAELAASVNLSLRIAIVVAGVVWAWQGLLQLWRLVRRR